MVSNIREGRYGLFQVMMVLQNIPLGTESAAGQSMDLGELTFEGIASEIETAKFDLMLTFAEEQSNNLGKKKLNGVFQYNTDLFLPETIELLSQHFVKLLNLLSSASAGLSVFSHETQHSSTTINIYI